MIKKEGKHLDNNLREGSWDSIHVIEVTDKAAHTYHYKLTTTIMLGLVITNSECGVLNLSGTFTRQVEEERQAKDDSTHLANIGRMVEAMESSMRSSVEVVYFDKTKDIVAQTRTITSLSQFENQKRLQEDIMKGMQAKKN